MRPHAVEYLQPSSDETPARGAPIPRSRARLVELKWVWVKVKPGIGPRVLVHVST